LLAPAGKSREESRAILEDVLLNATQPENVFTMRWQPYDFVVWCGLRLAQSQCLKIAEMKMYTQGVLRDSVVLVLSWLAGEGTCRMLPA